MTIYTCERCHYYTSRKCDFVDHLKRKNICNNEFTNTHPQIILETLLKPKNFICETCNKTFSHKKTLVRHKKDKHETNITNISSNSSVENHTNSANTTQHSHNMTSSNNTTTTNNSNNTTHTTNTNCHNNTNSPVINIQTLNVFGNESIDHVIQDPEFLLKCLKAINLNGIPDLIEKIWLNKDVPENQNLKLQREHHPKVMSVYTDETSDTPIWVNKSANEVLETLISKGHDLLVRHNDQYLTLSVRPSVDEQETFDLRMNRLSNITSKKRGVYIPIRDNILLKFRTSKNEPSL